MPSNKPLHGKYIVKRTDGRDGKGEKHEFCSYFVLDLMHDPAAVPAIRAFCDAARADRPDLVRSIEYQILSAVDDEHNNQPVAGEE